MTEKYNLYAKIASLLPDSEQKEDGEFIQHTLKTAAGQVLSDLSYDPIFKSKFQHLLDNKWAKISDGFVSHAVMFITTNKSAQYSWMFPATTLSWFNYFLVLIVYKYERNDVLKCLATIGTSLGVKSVEHTKEDAVVPISVAWVHLLKLGGKDKVRRS